MKEANEPSGPPSSPWQRLSPWSVVFILLAGVFRFVRENIPLLLGAGVGAAVFERIGPVEIAVAAGVLLGAAALVSLVYYRRFRFRLEKGVLLVRRGLIERQELKLQAGRIQHLSIQQPLYMRPFGLVRFSVDTPGSTAAEIELPGIRRDTAETLRARLGETGGAEGGTERRSGGDRDAEAAELFRATPGNLVLHGIASNYAYVAAAALSPFLHRIERFLAEHLGEMGLWKRFAEAIGSPFVAAVLLVSGFVLLMVFLSVTVSRFRFHGFVLTRENGRFRQRSGLLNRQEQVLSLAKLQSVEWVQTAVGRLVRRSHLVCRQVGVAATEGGAGGRTFLVPGLDSGSARRLSREFWPEVNPGQTLRRVHPYYRRSLLMRLGLVFGAAFAFLAAVSAEPLVLLGAIAAPVVLWPFIFQYWRVVGWATDREYVYFRSGLIGRRTVLFPSKKVQRAELSRSWFQRRRGVATVRLSLPSGPVTIPFLPEADARFLVDLTLYRIEVSDLRAGVRADGDTSPS